MQAFSWRPIEGCSFASAGCANCAALASADEDLVRGGARGAVWTGRTRLVADRLGQPAARLDPAVIYVCDHGDLFHEATPDAWIDQVFDQMQACPRHVFVPLTKRAGRQRDYLLARYGGALGPAHILAAVSAERQAELDVRCAALRQTPAAVRLLTLYPLLGPVDLSDVVGDLQAVYAGEEPQRPADPAWFAAIAAQCARAGVPFTRSEMLAADPRSSSTRRGSAD